MSFIKNRLQKVILGVLLATLCVPLHADFLEMPDVEEPPTLERKSLLRDLDIPNVRERDPDPSAGPRLDVREFRVQGLIEYPELGITREAIIKRVENIRFDMMAEGERLESGYTIDELAEVSDLIAEIEEETGEEHVGPLEVQRLVFLIREQRRRRGITLGMIETVADTITQYYRERGFILAKAYIPEQRVRDGVVNLTLLLGVLGEVAVNNAGKFRENTLRKPFNSLMGLPVTNDNIEERLYLLNDLPGLSAQGYFEPGSQVGDTKLNLNVIREESFLFNFRTDNHGGDQNGEYRAYADMQWNNITGFGDKLTTSLLYATEPGSTVYGAVRYGINLFSPRLAWEVGASQNAFELGKGSDDDEVDFATIFELKGESTIFDTAFTWTQKRSRTKNFKWSVGFEQVESFIDSDQVPTLKDRFTDVVNNTTLKFHYDILQEQDRRLHQGYVGLIQGKVVDGLSPAQDESFTMLDIDYTLLTFSKIPFTSLESRIVARSQLRYSGAVLSSVSQFGVGGPVKARAFSTNEFFADDAMFLSADWILSDLGFLSFDLWGASYSKVLQPFVFADAGFGRNNPRVEGERDQFGYLADIGLGLKIGAGRLRGNINVAFPLLGETRQEQPTVSTTGAIEYQESVNEFENKAKIYFDLQYSF